METALAVVFVLWLALTAATQVRTPRWQRPRAWDPFALLPMWWFFAPVPAQGDTHLLYRLRRADGAVGTWHEVRPGGRRTAWSAVWNPGRRERKTLIDAATDLLREAEASSDTIQVSLPYLALLAYVTRLPRVEPASSIQFLLMSSDREVADEAPVPTFVSGWHSVGERATAAVAGEVSHV